MSNDGSVVSRSLGKRSSVSDLLLDVADDCSFGALRDGKDVSDVQSSLLSAVDERSGSDTLGSDEGLLSELVSVWVSEDNNGEGSSTVLSARFSSTGPVSTPFRPLQTPSQSFLHNFDILNARNLPTPLLCSSIPALFLYPRPIRTRPTVQSRE